jgi:hypothetical protein
MNTPRLSALAPLLLLALAAGCADRTPVDPGPPAARAPSFDRGGTGKETVADMPIDFTIPAPTSAMCGLPAPITGTGMEHVVTQTKSTGNGRAGVTVITAAAGTASDALGDRYVWGYANRSHYYPDLTLPTRIVIADQFRLVGLGSAPSYRTAFHLTVTLDANGNVVSEDVSHVVGDPLDCDPI